MWLTLMPKFQSGLRLSSLPVNPQALPLPTPLSIGIERMTNLCHTLAILSEDISTKGDRCRRILHYSKSVTKRSSWIIVTIWNRGTGKFGLNFMNSNDAENARYTVVKPGSLARVGA